MRSQRTERVMVIGLDGATFDLIRPWIREGKLPHLADLMRRGVSGDLESTALPVSAVAWPSFFTGTNPGKHGIFAFRGLKQGRYDLEFANGARVRCKTLWQLLSEAGRAAIVVNIPMTYPPRSLNGILISGMDTPGIEANFTYPPELKHELLREVPDYHISLHLMGALNDDEGKRAKVAEDILHLLDARKRSVLYLARKYPWHMLAVRFNTPDTAQHHFWKYMDPSHPDYTPSERLHDVIERVHTNLDAAIGELMTLADPETTVIVMSDHGAGPRIPKAVYLNEWLRQKGLLAPMRGQKQHRGVLDLAPQMTEQGIRLLLRRLSHRSKDRLRRNLPGLTAKLASYWRFAGIDWSGTKAFVAETANIRINLKGREPQGIVEPGEEYEAVRNFIIQELELLIDPDTQEKVFPEVYRREDVFHGPYLEEAPDLLVCPRDFGYAVSQKFFRKPRPSVVVKEPHWRGTSGRHRKNGIFLIAGPNTRKDGEIRGSKIIDVAPTILYHMGLPIPGWMDGKVLSDCFVPGFVAANPPQYTADQRDPDTELQEPKDVYSDKEAQMIEERLQGLGYIE